MNENNLFNLDSFLEQEDGNAGDLPFPEVIPMPTVASKAPPAETVPQKNEVNLQSVVIYVMDMHSHNVMSARFSETDNLIY